ncbi:hypothetical protein F511_28139 [Dorcoceras hygrometricum]|uniref:Dystroglycan-like n=1 Tax=Dorcoceras hygrometricum TaxID=472368 RepID=A0A2Z7BRJ0_9LAMI|nr:hypothetical protein F511_28139 [Dorcoceras hygrometricum]
MDDQGMVSMFQALMASGLAGFLGCPAVIYEDALVDFFENASVRDGVIISTVAGQLVEISEEWFAESFDLPVDGLGDLSAIPKDVIFDARSIVSLSGEPVSLSGGKNQMKIEFRLICDIMAKAISVKAGSFNSITVEKFSLMTSIVCGVRMNWARILFSTFKKMVTPGTKQAKGFAVQISLMLENIPNLDLGESFEFPASKIFTDKTVHLFVSLNDKAGAEEATGAPKPKAASKKRPAADVEVAVAKKKRTIKTKSVTSLSTLKIMAVAQENLDLGESFEFPASKIFTDKTVHLFVSLNDKAGAEEATGAPKPKAASKKRPAADVEVAVAKKKRTIKTKSVTSLSTLKIMAVAQEIVPLQMVEPCPDVPAIEEHVKLPAAEEGISAAQSVEVSIGKVDTVIDASADRDKPADTNEERHWSDLSHEELITMWAAERIITSPADTMDVDTAGGDQQVRFSEEEPVVKKTNDDLLDDDEQTSLEDILLTIPNDDLLDVKSIASANMMTLSHRVLIGLDKSAEALFQQMFSLKEESAGALFKGNQQMATVNINQQVLFDSKTMSLE